MGVKKIKKRKQHKTPQNKREREMFELIQSGYSYQTIGEIYGISRQRVYQIVTGYGALNGSKWWDKRRELIFRRDNYTCLKCGTKDNLLVHHRDGNDRHNSINNLMTLCQKCHLGLHGKEEGR